MAKKRFDVRARKAELDFYRADDGGGTIWSLGTSGDPLNGSESADFLLPLTAGTGFGNTIFGLGGDDLVLGDIADLYVAPANNIAFGTAFDLDRQDSAWTIDENPLVAGDTAIPHATAYVVTEAGRREYFSIFIAAGQTITIDIDGGGGALGGADDGDTFVELFLESDLMNAVASNDDSAVTDCGYGSLQGPLAGITRDSFLTFTASFDGIYYLRIGESDGGDGHFEGGEEFLLNISLDGHVTGTPGAQNGDAIIGGDGEDHLFGAGGGDLIVGQAGNDLIFGGSGDDALNGEAGADVVAGGDGNDIIRGGAGIDMLDGGAGTGDTLVYFESAQAVTVDLSNGSVSGGDAAGDTIVNFENLDGSDAGNDQLYGDEGSNILQGFGGNDALFGYGGQDFLDGGAGADYLEGRSGNDIYVVDSSADDVVEFAGEGDDSVSASASFTLLANTSVETLTTTNPVIAGAIDLTGNAIANRIEGNNGVNILRGNAGNDSLFGFGGNDFLVGGAGTDIMVGGNGDDTYYVDETSDAISEFASQGFDRLATVITLALAADADIERLDVEALTSTNAIDLTGSAIANTIYGNDGQNILRGEAGNDELRGFGGNDFLVGGTGTDLMVGGLGDDTFYVDDASDAIGEIAGEGNDRIAASVSFILSNGANVELLEAVNLTATAAFDLTGSDSNNTITGNNGVNILRGEGGNDILSSAGGDDFLVGGSGVDAMTGGAGNDTYYVDDSADAVFEIAGEGGNDRIAAASSYALSANADVERLEADSQSGTDNFNLYGSSIANIVAGNNGFNVLDGKGGSDTLTGFGGGDVFVFTTALGAGNIDTITDFVQGTDRIFLDDAIFTALGFEVSPNAFVTGTAATTAAHRIIYNNATGQLFYDADGNGAGAQVQFAILQGAPALAASDFLVI